MNRQQQPAGVVLCGGQSRRMGRPKHDLPFGTETMLARILRLVGEVAAPVMLVAANDQRLDVPSGVRIARDRHPGRGPLEGLATGLEAAAATGQIAFVTSCDVPLLVTAVVPLLVQALDDYDSVAFRIEQRVYPLCAVYRCRAAAIARQLLQQDARVGPCALLQHSIHTRWLDDDDLRVVDPSLDSLHNVNEPADYVRAAQIAGVGDMPT